MNDEVRWTGTVPANGNVTVEFVVAHTGSYSESVLNSAEYSHSGSSGTAAVSVTIEPAPANTVNTAFLPVIVKE